jgi:hypothetical protein
MNIKNTIMVVLKVIEVLANSDKGLGRCSKTGGSRSFKICETGLFI